MDNVAESPRYDRNPSPPPELRENKELDTADKVGESAFSKHWIFSTLMKLIQEVDEESDKPEADQSELGIDVNEDLQNELCELWDMSMNPDVAAFLLEFKAMDILGGVIRKSKAPRVVEICVGILGNMACSEDVCLAISNNTVLVSLLLSLLNSRDPQTLVETSRLCYVCLCSPKGSSIWLKAIKDSDDFQENLKFIFQSSTNVELLKKAADFLDKLLELDDDLCKDWGSQDMVHAILEALQQVGYSHSETLEVYLHIFELLSTTEQGVQALVSEQEKVVIPLRKYLMGVCEYEIVGLDGRERCLSSALAVFNVIFSSSTDVSTSFIEDEQSMRCLLKILYPLYFRVQELASSNVNQSHPSSSTSDSKSVEVNGKESSSDEKCDNSESKDVNEKSDSVAGNGQSKGDNSDRAEEGSRDSQYLLLLYEVLQGFLSDVITYLHSSLPPEGTNKEELSIPSVLNYLNSMCSRERMRCLINTLEEMPTPEDEPDHIMNLSDIAQRYYLRRLSDIIDNVPSRQNSTS